MIGKEELIDYVQTQAEFLNVRYFDGVLRFKVVIAKSVLKRKFAWVAFSEIAEYRAGRPPRITINPCFEFANNLEIEEIIVHEMLHIMQIHLGMKLGHGKAFYDLGMRFGVPVESCKRFSSAAVRTPRQMVKKEEPRNVKQTKRNYNH